MYQIKRGDKVILSTDNVQWAVMAIFDEIMTYSFHIGTDETRQRRTEDLIMILQKFSEHIGVCCTITKE